MHAASGLEGGRRKSSLLTFGTFGHTKVRYKKSFSMFLYGGSKPPPYAQSPSTTNRQNKRYAFHPVSAGTGVTPAMHFQRACRQCVHESARLFRVLCLHAWQYEIAGSAKLTTCTINLCRTYSPRTARATDSCTPPVVWKEDGASPPC